MTGRSATIVDYSNIHAIACECDRVAHRDLKDGDVIIASCNDGKRRPTGFAHLWRIHDGLAVNIWCEDAIQNELIKREFNGQTFGIPIELLTSAYGNDKKLKRLKPEHVEALGMRR